MRKVRVKKMRALFEKMYALACEEAKAEGVEIIPKSAAWRIFKKNVKQTHG